MAGCLPSRWRVLFFPDGHPSEGISLEKLGHDRRKTDVPQARQNSFGYWWDLVPGVGDPGPIRNRPLKADG